MASNVPDNKRILVKDRSIQPTDLKGEQKEGYRKVVIRNLAAGMKAEEFFDLIPGWITAETCLFHYYMPGKVASNKAKLDSPSTAYIGFVSEEVANKFRVYFMKNIAQTFSAVPMVEPAPYQGKVKLPLSDKPKDSWKEDPYFAEYKKWLKDPSLPRPIPLHSSTSKPVTSVEPKPVFSGKKAGKAKGKKKGSDLDRDSSGKKDEEHDSADAPKLSRKAAKRERAVLKQQKKAASTTANAAESSSGAGENYSETANTTSETNEFTSGSVLASTKSSKRKNKLKEKQKEGKEHDTVPGPASQEKKKPKRAKKPKPSNTDSGTSDALPSNQPSEASGVDNANATSQQSDSPKLEKKPKKTKKNPKATKLSLDSSDEIPAQAKKPAKPRKVKEKRTHEKQLRVDEKLDTENQNKPIGKQVNETEVKSG